MLSPIQDTRRDQATPPGLHRPARFWIRAGDTSIALARPRTVQPPSSSAARTVESNTELARRQPHRWAQPTSISRNDASDSPTRADRQDSTYKTPGQPRCTPGQLQPTMQRRTDSPRSHVNKRVPLTPYDQSPPPRPPTTHISPRPPLRHRQLHSAPIHLQPDRPLPPPLPPPTPTQTEPPRLVRPSGG